MKLWDIIKDCGIVSFKGEASTEITSITSDSRRCAPGCLFIAMSGSKVDGRSFIAQAVEAGAVAVMAEGPIEQPIGCESVAIVSDCRLAAAMAADSFYGHPSRELQLVGITGTNGKTTTVTLLYNMFKALGHRCGLLSTIANFVGDERRETVNTTSDPITINSLLREMVDCGCEYCFMEVSSIGVEQKRVDGLQFSVGIFSNLTHDHLDYHGTFAEYLRCKKAFFDNLPAHAKAIVNIDDRNGMVMVQNTKAEIITYSCRSASDHKCRILEQGHEGMLLNLDGTEVWTRLIGGHNAYNILAIYCTALALGTDKEEALVALSTLEAASGRLETISGPKGLTVVIDYAHTPDALENVLKTLREVSAKSELICLFGCGGDRDKSKRPEMGAIAQKYSDRIFLSSDNSRSERTEDIIADIKGGMDTAGLSKTLCIADRKEAIRTAILLAPPASTILLAGKGHETYQIIGNDKTHFDEREIVNEVFNSIGQ